MSTPSTAAESLASTSSGTVDRTIGAGVETVEGAGDGETAGAWVDEGDGAGVVGPVEHARLNTAMPPSPPVAAMDTKSLLELVSGDCVMVTITPAMVSASLPTLTVLGE